MNKVLITILVSLLSSTVSATDMPPRCNGQEVADGGGEVLAGLSMPAENYNITSESDGEFHYLKVSVPSSHEGLPISQINLKRMVSGKPVLAAGLALDIIGNAVTTKSILMWPSEIESISFNVVYATYQKCQEGYSYLKESRAYDLVYKHNK
ncbi:hypothetical protein P3339_17165 [Microbulbifer sp. MLAF003]|uniref:hypothetical protein n=1 Tax=Microbulbifer sp. MLAF003 TaxID=3032582 RepID=UPI0024ADF46B|nr:hypothetical protein [Microbulbifer sp. MLAF003]WHI50161.1 hypothetical protein P3339_17165 [Microbulbifer sp. MLAF003]